MTKLPTDVLAIGPLDAGDVAFIDALLKIGKAPLGWDGEFCARFFLEYSQTEALPMGVVMCLEPSCDAGKWAPECSAGTLVVASPKISPEQAKQVLSAGGILFVAESSALARECSPSPGVLRYETSDELLLSIKSLLKDDRRRMTLAAANLDSIKSSRSCEPASLNGVKVLHVIQAVSLGGAVRALLGLVPYLGARFQHTILSLAPTQVDPNGVALAASYGVKHIAAQSLADAKQLIESSDIVHVHWWNNPELDALLREELPPARYIGWLHVGGHDAPQLVTREVADFFSRTVACSPFTLEAPGFQELSESDRDSKCAMVYGATDFARLAGFKRRPHGGFTIGYVGTVDFLKMHPDYVALSAAAKIADAKFVVCGVGRAEAVLKHQASELGMAERFDIRGYVEDIRGAFETFDVYGYPLCPDTYAAAELNLQEAMFLGIPPVVFPYGGLKRLVVNDFTGFVVHSAREYAQALEHLYHSPADRERIGSNAAEYARQIFGSENAAAKFKPLYEELLSRPKERRAWNLEGERAIQAKLRPGAAVSSRGAMRFISTLGESAESFIRSFSGGDDKDLLAAEELISRCTELMRSSGIRKYSVYYPTDPYLRLWSGLVSLQEGNGQEAMLGFSEAYNNGLIHWRVIWYLSKAARATGNLPLAEQLLGKVKEVAPGAPI